MTRSTSKLSQFFHHFPLSEYPKHHVVLAADEQNEFFYYVETGAVKMTRMSKSGKNLILHIFFPHSFFSLLCLLTKDVNEYDYITLVPTTLRKVPKAELIAFLKTHNDEMFELQLRLLSGLQGLLNRIEQSSFSSAYNQVASLLIYFSNHLADEDENNSQHTQTLQVMITHQEIADWLGLSRENVSLQMKRLENEGLIRLQKHLIEILDHKKLLNLT